MNTTIIQMTDPNSCFQGIEKAVEALKNGGLVVFPTETVYGIAANGDDPGAVALLYEVKGRPVEKQLAIYVADLGEIRRYVSDIPILARRLIKRTWPGPLTIVFPQNLSSPPNSTYRASDGSVGLRMPNNAITLELIRASDKTIVGTSANLSGKRAAVTAEEVMEYLDGKVDVILDGGHCPIQEPSTVVKVNHDSYEILREGAISAAWVRKLTSMVILFVCTGNTCRSAMAEVLCRKAIEEKLKERPDSIRAILGEEYTIISAGTNVAPGSFAAKEATEVIREFGCDLSKHCSRPLTPTLIREVDMIFTMTAAQLEDIKYWLNEYEQVSMGSSGDWDVEEYRPQMRLLHPDGKDILDPVGESVETYRQCAQEIERCIKELVKGL